jgi:hypothetical protein
MRFVLVAHEDGIGIPGLVGRTCGGDLLRPGKQETTGVKPQISDHLRVVVKEDADGLLEMNPLHGVALRISDLHAILAQHIDLPDEGAMPLADGQDERTACGQWRSLPGFCLREVKGGRGNLHFEPLIAAEQVRMNFICFRMIKYRELQGLDIYLHLCYYLINANVVETQNLGGYKKLRIAIVRQ